MTDANNDLLSQLVDNSDSSIWDSLQKNRSGDDPDGDARLDELLGRLGQLTSKPIMRENPTPKPQPAVQSAPPLGGEFLPVEPCSFHEMGLTESEIEALVVKYLLSRGDATGRDIAAQVKVPFKLLEELMRDLKQQQLVFYRATSTMNDYVYQLTDLGRERARRFSEHCTYFGAAPVVLSDYVRSVAEQSLTRQHPSRTDLERTFKDLLINPNMMKRLGPAINSGKGMFLYGAPGNGKTSIARRVTRAFGKYIWMPRALGVEGEIIRLFDPLCHQEAPLEGDGSLLLDKKIDPRWVRVVRPTIVVGGELTMANLEVMLNQSTGINEAPLQLKANCGTLVIDDFGRQRMPVDELLNRWIVPLEDRVDYLNLASGKTVQVPFDQLIVFSTNLEPQDLVDEAFLRRIPYKVEVVDPSEEDFRKLFELMCPGMGITFDAEVIDYLVETHYKKTGRPFRCCHPRDLLQQVHDLCLYLEYPLELKKEYFDAAVENYFSVV